MTGEKVNIRLTLEPVIEVPVEAAHLLVEETQRFNMHLEFPIHLGEWTYRRMRIPYRWERA